MPEADSAPIFADPVTRYRRMIPPESGKTRDSSTASLNGNPFSKNRSREAALIRRVVKKAKLQDFSEVKENLSYWLSKDPEERVGAVECLRRRLHGSSARLQRSARVIQRSQR